MHRIYTLTQKAIEEEKTWDEAIEENEIETVEEFDTLEEAEQAYQSYDQDLHGVE